MAKKSAKIKEIQGFMAQYGALVIEEVDIEALKELGKELETIEDKRFQPYVEHLLSDIVLICLMAVMANSNEWCEIADFVRHNEAWFRKFLKLPNGIPSHDTIQRVMSMIDGSVLYSLCIGFLVKRLDILAETGWLLRSAQEEIENGEERPVIAVDGKTSRGSKRNKTDRDAVKAMHTVSAYSTDRGLCLSEVVVEEKTNEIPATQDLLDIIDIRGCIVTWDALNTQKETVKKVIGKGGDYVGALKGNQHNFYEDVELFYDEKTRSYMAKDENLYSKTVEKEQNGLATREYFLSTDILWFARLKDWAGLRSIGCVIRTLEKLDGSIVVEKRFFIASITDIHQFARAVRSHWQVENKLHWHLDYTFKDDQNTTLKKNGARNLQTMKRVSLAILSLVQSFFDKRSLKRIRFILSLDFDKYIETIFKLLNASAIQDLLLPRPQ